MMLDDKEWACKSALLFMIKDEKGNGEGMAKKILMKRGQKRFWSRLLRKTAVKYMMLST